MQPIVIFIITCGIVALSLAIGNRAPFASLEAMLDDVRTSWLGRLDPIDQRIVIIAITEQSQEVDEGLSPINRSFLGRLITAVDSAEPAVIGLDVLLDRPSQPAKDQIIREALSATQAPLILIATGMPKAFERTMLVGQRVASPMLNVDGSDGVVRQFATHDRSGVMVLAASIASQQEKLKETSLSEIRYGLTPRGELPFQIIPAHQYLATPALRAALRGRYVLIGGTFQESDRHLTPLRYVEGLPDRLPGVVLHAFQLRQLLSQNQVPQSWPWTVFSVVLATVIGFATGRSVLPTIAQIIIFLSSLILLCLFGTALFALSQIMINLVAVGIAIILSMLAGFGMEGQYRRAQILSVRKAFGTFLAPDYVQMLERDPGLVTAAAKRTNIAVLFTDLSGFTALVERLAPEAIESFLNEYLDLITTVIVAAGGTIDKIVGDGIHALFGVPIAHADAAERALACAKEIVRVTEAYRAKQLHMALGMTRIGAHFGTALVGNFGGSHRLDYTAHGTTINITSRLEAANSALGTQVCISEAIYLAANSPLGWRFGGSVWLRGVQGALPFLTLSHDIDQDGMTGAALKQINIDPSQSFAQFQKLDPADPLVQLHLKRLSQGLCSTLIDLR